MKRHEKLNLLIEKHLYLVLEVCRENRTAVRNIGKDEAIAIGNLALVQSSRSCPQLENFAAYARVAIRCEILRANKYQIPSVPLNGHDPVDYRDIPYYGPEVASVLTEREKRFMQYIEESKMGPRKAHEALARRLKQKQNRVRKRHRQILDRIAEASSE